MFHEDRVEVHPVQSYISVGSVLPAISFPQHTRQLALHFPQTDPAYGSTIAGISLEVIWTHNKVGALVISPLHKNQCQWSVCTLMWFGCGFYWQCFEINNVGVICRWRSWSLKVELSRSHMLVHIWQLPFLSVSVPEHSYTLKKVWCCIHFVTLGVPLSHTILVTRGDWTQDSLWIPHIK